MRSLLRPSERLLLVLEGSHLRPGGESERDSKASPPISFDDTSLESASEESRVILAVVGHVNHAMEEYGRSLLNIFLLSSSAKHSPKRVSLHRG